MDSSNHGPEQPGSSPSNESVPWCICNNCREMDTAVENVCCRKSPCVTSYESFFIGCVHHLILTIDDFTGESHVRIDCYNNHPMLQNEFVEVEVSTSLTPYMEK